MSRSADLPGFVSDSCLARGCVSTGRVTPSQWPAAHPTTTMAMQKAVYDKLPPDLLRALYGWLTAAPVSLTLDQVQHFKRRVERRAVTTADTAHVLAVLERGEEQSPPHGTPFHRAAVAGVIPLLQVCIETLGVPVDWWPAVDAATQRNGPRMTALMLAAYNGRAAAVTYLLSRGANAHARNRGGWTAAYGAIHTGNLTIADTGACGWRGTGRVRQRWVAGAVPGHRHDR